MNQLREKGLPSGVYIVDKETNAILMNSERPIGKWVLIENVDANTDLVRYDNQLEAIVIRNQWNMMGHALVQAVIVA